MAWHINILNAYQIRNKTELSSHTLKKIIEFCENATEWSGGRPALQIWIGCDANKRGNNQYLSIAYTKSVSWFICMCQTDVYETRHGKYKRTGPANGFGSHNFAHYCTAQLHRLILFSVQIFAHIKSAIIFFSYHSHCLRRDSVDFNAIRGFIMDSANVFPHFSTHFRTRRVYASNGTKTVFSHWGIRKSLSN